MDIKIWCTTHDSEVSPTSPDVFKYKGHGIYDLDASEMHCTGGEWDHQFVVSFQGNIMLLKHSHLSSPCMLLKHSHVSGKESNGQEE